MPNIITHASSMDGIPNAQPAPLGFPIWALTSCLLRTSNHFTMFLLLMEANDMQHKKIWFPWIDLAPYLTLKWVVTSPAFTPPSDTSQTMSLHKNTLMRINSAEALSTASSSFLPTMSTSMSEGNKEPKIY